ATHICPKPIEARNYVTAVVEDLPFESGKVRPAFYEHAAISRFVLTATIAISTGPVHSLVAQAKPPALATATHMKCAFSLVATAAWTKDGSASNEVKKADLVLEYRSI